jgi:hypothetical protein
MSKQPEFKPPPFFYPVEADLFQPVASFRQSIKEGNHYYVRFEITRELWELFEEPDPGLHLRGPLYRVRDDASDETPADKEKAKEKPKREKKPPKESGPFASYWSILCHKRILESADLMTALDVSGGPAVVKTALYEVFQVDSLSDIAPVEFEKWCEGKGLAFLVTLSRNAAAEAGL